MSILYSKKYGNIPYLFSYKTGAIFSPKINPIVISQSFNSALRFFPSRKQTKNSRSVFKMDLDFF